ncbi:MAG: hypothetical protein ACTSRU_01875 [Candidatus Hodarchaeales archaeon]
MQFIEPLIANGSTTYSFWGNQGYQSWLPFYNFDIAIIVLAGLYYGFYLADLKWNLGINDLLVKSATLIMSSMIAVLPVRIFNFLFTFDGFVSTGLWIFWSIGIYALWYEELYPSLDRWMQERDSKRRSEDAVREHDEAVKEEYFTKRRSKHT